MISIFADKTTLILRKMLAQPDKEWVIRDFDKKRDKIFGVGHGRIQKTLNELDKLGYIERKKRGVNSSSILTNPEELLLHWVKYYSFSYNKIYFYYSADKHILKKLNLFLKGKEGKYALTLHSAANLHTSFVKTEDIYMYLNAKDLKKELLDIRQHLDLKQLVRGGNIHIIKPYYKYSAFFNAKKLKGYRIVSDLQLYLDLFNFQPRGREHAEYLKKLITKKGEHLE